MTSSPDHVTGHEPAACRSCGAGLAGAAQAGTERRQVIDLPPVKAVVTEHLLVSRRCACGTVTRAAAPAGVRAPVQYGPVLSGIGAYLWHGQFLSRNRTCQAMTELFGVPASPGTVTAMAARVAAAAAPVLELIRGRVAVAPLAHFDETGFRVAGKVAWVRSASTPEYSLITRCMPGAAPAAWTLRACSRGSAGSHATTHGRRMTPTGR
jgi:transposase